MNDTSMLFAMVTAAFIGGAVIVFVIALSHQYKSRLRESGVSTLQVLRSLLINIQRHRGLSAGVLTGNLSFRADLELAQESVSRDLAYSAQQSDWLNSNMHWQAITSHWARLAGQYQRLDLKQVIDQHNRLINNLLELMGEVSEAHQLASTEVSNQSWQYCLRLGEWLGQLRALGVAYLGSLECGLDSPVLRKMLSEGLDHVRFEIAATQCLQYLDASERDAVTNFIDCWPQEIIASKTQSGFSQTDYFDTATNVIDRVYQKVDAALEGLK